MCHNISYDMTEHADMSEDFPMNTQVTQQDPIFFYNNDQLVTGCPKAQGPKCACLIAEHFWNVF